MNFNDLFKNSVIEKLQSGDVSVTAIVITLLLAVAFGLFIYFVYKFNSRSGFYNRSFNRSLAVLPVITAAIMIAMGSNLTISLGMVGALSIVRFRNAVKDPQDLTYLFWSISIGIVTGAGLFELSLILSLLVALLVSLLDLIPSFKAPCLLVVCGENAECEAEIMNKIKAFTRKYKVRSRNINKNGTEWIIELQVKDESKLVSEVSGISSVSAVQLMTHDGDVRF